MATAQSLFIDEFVRQINTNVNVNTLVIASRPSPAVLRITARNTDTPLIAYLTGGSSVTGTGAFTAKPATGSPQYAELWFSWTLAPGDTVKLNVSSGARSTDLTYNLPLATTVDPGGFDHSTVGGVGGSGGVAVGGSGIGSANARRLVVVECGSASPSFGALFALDPQDASGIPIPTFRVVTSLPPSGSSLGESVYNTATRQGYVWDGNAWRDITASPIRSFPNDAALQANTTEQLGAYAVASDTGNMYVRVLDGWRRIGIAEFSTYNDLNAWDAAIGTQAISRDLDVMFLRVQEVGFGEKWIPITQLVADTAKILATQNIAGLVATATDTGTSYVNNGTRWVQDPIEHHATEAALLATPPVTGHLAWADDTGTIWNVVNGAWRRLPAPTITYGPTKPGTPGAGDVWWDGNQAGPGIEMYTGTAWKTAASWGDFAVGSIQQSLLTEAQFATSMGADAPKWVLADGRNVAGSRYAAITGSNTVPDLRGGFFRAAGQNQNNQANWNGGTVGTWHNDTTRAPRNTAFTADAAGAHDHGLVNGAELVAANTGGHDLSPSGGGNPEGIRRFYHAGNHTHTISGGDAETAPSHFSLNTFIRVE